MPRVFGTKPCCYKSILYVFPNLLHTFVIYAFPTRGSETDKYVILFSRQRKKYPTHIWLYCAETRGLLLTKARAKGKTGKRKKQYDDQKPHPRIA